LCKVVGTDRDEPVICSRCGIEKPLEEYRPGRRVCRACRRIDGRAHDRRRAPRPWPRSAEAIERRRDYERSEAGQAVKRAYRESLLGRTSARIGLERWRLKSTTRPEARARREARIEELLEIRERIRARVVPIRSKYAPTK
jgi:hypothetical protein